LSNQLHVPAILSPFAIKENLGLPQNEYDPASAVSLIPDSPVAGCSLSHFHIAAFRTVVRVTHRKRKYGGLPCSSHVTYDVIVGPDLHPVTTRDHHDLSFIDRSQWGVKQVQH
jgi:hypothetical protein